MKISSLFRFLGLALACMPLALRSQSAGVPAEYNITWTSQSEDSGDSMPCVGGDIGLNAWVENDELLFYIGRAGCRDENGSLLKMGRVRMSINPSPFSKDAEFRQTLNLQTGAVEINARNLLFHLRRRIHWRASLGRGKGGCGGKGKIFGISRCSQKLKMLKLEERIRLSAIIWSQIADSRVQFPRPAAAFLKNAPQDFWNRKNYLSVRDLIAYGTRDPLTGGSHTSLVARRAEVAGFTGEG